MSTVLLAGLPPGVPGWLAGRLAGHAVLDAGSPDEAAGALRRGGVALVVAGAAFLRAPFAAALAAPGAPSLVLLADGVGEGEGVDSLRPARVLPMPLDREVLVAAVTALLGDGKAPARPSFPDVGAAVAQVWERFREPVLRRVDTLERAALSLLEGRLGDEARREAEREAHKLAGSVGTFGFAEAGRLAREAEQLLAAPGALGQGEALRLADLAVGIRHELSASPAPSSAFVAAGSSAGSAGSSSGGSSSGGSPASPGAAGAGGFAGSSSSDVLSSTGSAGSTGSTGSTGSAGLTGSAGSAGPLGEGDGPLLLIVEADGELAERLAMEASGRGLRTVAARSVEEARAALARARPDAALVDLAEHGRSLDLLRELADRDPPVPAIVLTGSDDFADRVEVARHGGRGFLRTPIPPGRALDAVSPLLERAPRRDAVVLAVDDEPAILEAVRAVLSYGGVRVETLGEPRRFWEALESASPDVVLLDVEMPGIDGLDLCRVLRNDARWRSVPVVFLSARTDPETVRRVFDAGADDYVVKPFVGPELVARIHNRLERVRLQRSLAETDPLTGVANRRGSEEVLERFLRLAGGQGEPFALAVVDLDRFKEVNDRWGHATGDEVLVRVARLLHKRFRSEDVVARWGGEEFVVGMYGMDKADGVQRLAEALELLREEHFAGPDGEPFRVTFSAGVAEFPADGRDVHALYRAADSAMYRAKAAGRNRVTPVGWDPDHGEGPRGVDVLVVEDDPAIARLLEHALETRGYRHEWVESGARAAELLTAAGPPLRARVVLLDVDLPGLDGLGVLRRLSEAGLLDRTRVIMLTVRTHEAEVVRALEMGAFDHVSKPFSVPVLLQRVRRALRT